MTKMTLCKQGKEQAKSDILLSDFQFCLVLVKAALTIPNDQTAQSLNTSDITQCLSSHQAQSRVQESSQKLDILRLSLEKCLKEKNQDPLQQPTGGVDPSTGPLSSQNSSPKEPVLSSSFFSIRPASLTGINTDLVVFEQNFCNTIRFYMFLFVCGI